MNVSLFHFYYTLDNQRLLNLFGNEVNDNNNDNCKDNTHSYNLYTLIIQQTYSIKTTQSFNANYITYNYFKAVFLT